MRPVTRYARNGDVSLAYQVIGEGERDLVFTTGWWLAFESLWEDPACARALESMASFARVILWDKRGTGMSDRVALPTLEERMDDLGAVMDAAGSDSATLFGFSEGGCMGALFAASYPERCDALVLCGSFARPVRDGDEQSWMPVARGRGVLLLQGDGARVGRRDAAVAPVGAEPRERPAPAGVVDARRPAGRQPGRRGGVDAAGCWTSTSATCCRRFACPRS